MTNIIKKLRCSCGAKTSHRDLSEYYFHMTDYKGRDLYECKKCKDWMDKYFDRERRKQDNNERQYEESIKIRDAKFSKKLKKLQKSKEQDIWDDEVRNELCKGLKLTGLVKYQFKESIPKELLQIKRASMQLDRIIKSTRKSEQENKELKQKEIEKLNQSLIECKKHGSLFLIDVIRSGQRRGMQQYKCRQCMQDLHRDHYQRNKENILKKQAEYRINNLEKVKEIKNKSRKKMNVKNNQHEVIEG